MKVPPVGQPIRLSERLRAVLAPNPGPMTYHGTNSFIIGEGTVAIVDPGPDDPAHLNALLGATKGEKVAYILVTHAHLDHSALAPRLSDRVSAPIIAFGGPDAGRSDLMRQFAEDGIGGGEGVHHDFAPDQTVVDGDMISIGAEKITVRHIPGHFAGQIAFDIGDGTALSGDHVMAWSSSLVSPPDGDVAAFRETTRRLLDMNHTRLFPAHGPALDAPSERLRWLLNHRQAREDDILSALTSGSTDLSALTARIYTDTPRTLHPAAARNVLAHLIDLWQRNLVTASPTPSDKAVWTLA